MKKNLYLAMLMALPTMAQQTEQVATFEDLPLEKESFWNGSDGTGSFTSGMFRFENGYVDYGAYGYAYGFYYSNMTATNFSEYTTDQYNSCVGHGAEDSENYAVYNVNIYNPKGVQVLAEGGAVVGGCYITNAASAYQSMLNGDEYAKKFGDGDWFKLTITGLNAEGTPTGSVDFYLADFREAGNAYIVSDWQWVDLSGLGKVARLSFDMSSSDSGQWGMNTPAYFCLDNLGASKPEDEPAVAIRSIQPANAEPMAIYSLNGVRRNALQSGLNIVKYADGTTKKVLVK